MSCECPIGMCICDLMLPGDKKFKKTYLQRQADKHKVTHEFSGQMHFFKVKSGNGDDHNISMKVGCDCTYMGVQGLPNGKICSHVLAVLKDVLIKGDIQLNSGKSEMKTIRRNACTKLVRISNRSLNEVKTSPGESKAHQDKKKELCRQLELEGKHYMTEAIFILGGRADILVLDDFKVIEIVKTEQSSSIMHKLETYPDGLKMEVVRC